jgi:hypothetical protein
MNTLINEPSTNLLQTITNLTLILITNTIIQNQLNIIKIKNLIKNSSNTRIVPVFSRLDTLDTVNCNFCKKIASYHDMELINYCWFHRTQYEE